ncbi:hypothetical protein THTE_2145 [Thermogutta terrifontis]|uniref:Uncharacterized protein n=1 Tax=Thermogutta terrifontis TaxID=1331910 RepID=A0A286RFM2_9BACT|nr:hypothetical protein THTE_2145 [Thermogutta terrifontis]
MAVFLNPGHAKSWLPKKELGFRFGDRLAVGGTCRYNY